MIRKHESNLVWQTPVRIALFVLLALQFCLIAYYNLTFLDKNIDCDLAKVISHFAEVCRQKTLLLPDWDYLTTLEWDCSGILAIPFYAVTNDILLSFGLANIVLTVCFWGMIFLLFRGEDLIYPLFCANFLVIPYSVGLLEYYDMLFFGAAQYIIKVSVPILLIGIITGVEKGNEIRTDTTSHVRHKSGERGRYYLLMAVYLGLLFLTCVSSGVYVTLCGVLPVFAVYAGYKFFKWERIPYSILFIMACSVILTLTGWRLNSIIMGGALGNHMTLSGAEQLTYNMTNVFVELLAVLGGTAAEPHPVLSPDGIQIIAKSCLTYAILISGALSLVKCFTKKGNLRSLLLLSVFIWNYYVLLNLPLDNGIGRYHLIGLLPLMCAACSLWLDGIRKLQAGQQKCFYAAGFAAIIFLVAISNYKLYSQNEDDHSNLKELCAYVEEYNNGLHDKASQHVDFVYLLNDIDSSEICRALDENSIYLCLLADGVTICYDYYDYYNNAPMQTQNAWVVINAQNDMGDGQIAGYELHKFDTVANWNLYCFEDY